MTINSPINLPADNKHRKAALRFLSLTTPAYVALFIILILIRSLNYDYFSDHILLLSMAHIFGIQTILLLLVRSQAVITRAYIKGMLWFMVYDNIILFCYWLIVLTETRTFIYILAPMSTVALFSITSFRQAMLYNAVLCLAMAIAAALSDMINYQEIDQAGQDWVYISVYFIVSIWLSRTAAVHADNRSQLWQSIRVAEDAKKELEYTLKQLESANKELEKVSLTDALTQVHNRRYFDNSIEKSWSAALITQRALSVMMIDVDHFKSFNDEHGHQTGDACLQFIASSIATCLGRPDDEICRYGGEEFAVILPNTNAQAAISVAERIRVTIAENPFRHQKLTLTVHVSIGIATLSGGKVVERPETLTQLADKALYQAKANGRNQVVHASQLNEA